MNPHNHGHQGDLYRSLQRLEIPYEEMGGPPILVERPLYQLVELEQDSQDLGASPPTGMQALQEIQDLPPTPAPSEPPGHRHRSRGNSCSSC